MNPHRIAFLAAIAMLQISTAWSHDPGFSTAFVTVRPGGIEALVTYSRNEIEASGAQEPSAPAVFQIGERSTSIVPPEFDSEDNVIYRIEVPRPTGSEVTFSVPLLARLAPGHRQLLLVRDEEHSVLLQQYLHLGAEKASITLPEATRSNLARMLMVFANLAICGVFGLTVIHAFRRSPSFLVSSPPKR